MAAESLRIERVGVSVSGKDLLSNIQFSLHPGELCALIGPSGAGKSTLMKVLLGIRRPQEGEVRLGSRHPTDAGPVGYVPQDDALHRTLSVDRELAYAAELRLPNLDRKTRAAQVERVIHDLGLSDRRQLRISALSGGQRKRVSVALELLTRPRLLILDEPTSGLDPGLESTMMALFAEVASSGRIVLVATHAMESLKRCHALLLLVEGRVVYFGPPTQAAEYFSVDRFASIFPRLQEAKPADWARKWREAPLRRSFSERPRPTLKSEQAA